MVSVEAMATDPSEDLRKLLIRIWGRCYDHNFLRFLPIFVEKIGVFLKKQCYDQMFA
jgi:hypothetical protein